MSEKQIPISLEQLRIQSIGSGKWVLLSNVIPKVLTPALSVILARLLLPGDYGIIGIGTLILALLTMMQQAGLGPALIQREQEIELAASVAFWLNLGISVLLYLLLWILSPWIAAFYTEPALTSLCRVLGVQVIILSFVVPQMALLTRNFEYRKLFVIQVISTLAPFTVSIPLAIRGAGYWSLAGGILIGNLANVILFWGLSTWRPRFVLDLKLIRELLGFGRFVLLESILAWLLIYCDNAVVGKILGTKALGLYATGFNLAVMIIVIPLSAVTGVVLPTFSRMQNNREALRKSYLEGTRLVALYAIPAAMGLSLISVAATRLIFGERWQGLGLILGILGLYSGFGNLWALNSDAFRSIGRPDIIPKIYLVLAPIMLTVYIVSAPYGLVVFCITRACVVIISAPVHIWATVKYIGVSKSYLWDIAKIPLAASVIMCGGITLLQQISRSLPTVISLPFIVLISAVVYVVLVRVLDQKSYTLITGFINGLVQKSATV